MDSMEFESILVSKGLPDAEFSQKVLLMLIDLSLPTTMHVILPPAPSVLQGEVRTLVSIHAKAFAAKRLRSSQLRGKSRFWPTNNKVECSVSTSTLINAYIRMIASFT